MAQTVKAMQIGQYLTLEEFCTCTQTYQKYADRIDPYPGNRSETIPALETLCHHILDPMIYGFYSKDLKRFLAQKDPETGIKNGRVEPSRDQHMAHEKNRSGKYYCDRLGAACDFRIVDLESDRLIEWILEQRLPFDSLYYYRGDRPIHVSYSLQHRRNIRAFSSSGVPTTKQG